MAESSSGRDGTASPPASDTLGDSKTESSASGGRGRLERLLPGLAKPIRKAGFWGAILLPFVYAPLLFVGLSTWIEAVVFLALVVLNLFALYVGHSHRR
ncbi:hypothetical protein [Halobiforma nitratireducens]|uniref:Uncharacterized protein n=1 Tax=Halobiforma nitratireducens JCM 10879 TaxID=1227454 RepID=M0MRQ2_9EURY|nr:hypothetical protein [Halobiforma nitratireducens]EMA47135.1 hypothetical protein C446_00430 [Halobiforma nitratireducens JCM 10879]